MKKILVIALILASFQVASANKISYTDTLASAVHFESGSWKQIQKLARKEKKYVFVDCYTTWCGPCKLMETEVYTKPEVGEFMSKNFVSVKMQMDKTPGDNEDVRKRYSDAAMLQKDHGIAAYPSYFVFSPEGKLVTQGVGYKGPDDFIGFVSGAIDPTAAHPYARYYNLLAEYQKGKKDYTIIPLLLDTATQLGQTETAATLQKDYSDYLKTLSDDALYNPQIIGYLSKRVVSSKSRYFHLFYPNTEKVNKLMGKQGYGQMVVAGVIRNEIIDTALKTPTGMRSTGGEVRKDAEPDWKLMFKMITEQYDTSYADENVLRAKAAWYAEHHNFANYAKYFTLLVQKYGANMDANTGDDCSPNFMDCDLNGRCWTIFKGTVDKDQIDAAILCMKGVLARYKRTPPGYVPESFIDTYANLLYKAGKTEEAIQQEQSIVDYLTAAKAPEANMGEFKSTIEKMKKGEPTWPSYVDDEYIFGMH
jgi:thioredoxin-related protein